MATNPASAVWVDTDDDLSALVTRHQNCSTYALDTEFMSGVTFAPVLALVQLAVDDVLYLIDPLACDVRLLAPLLNSPALMIAHAPRADLELLVRETSTRPSRLFDTQLAGQLLGYSSPSLATVASRLCDVELDKSARLSDWTVRPLGAEPLRYAASDVAYLHDIYRAQVRLLKSNNKLAWLEEECEALRTLDYSAPDPERAWLRLKGLTGMSAGDRQRAREIAKWRQVAAERRDRTPSRVMTDDALLALVRRPPKSVDDLRSTRSLGKLSDKEARSLLEAIAGAPATSPAVLERSAALDHDIDMVVTLLLSCVTQLGHDARIDPSLLATRADIAAFVSRNPSRIDSGWRSQVLSPVLQKIIDGAVDIRVAKGGKFLSLVDGETGELVRVGAAQ